jgi:MULE transposase domain
VSEYINDKISVLSQYQYFSFRNDDVIPGLYALLPNKQQATYTRLFAAVKNLQHGLHPQTIMTDFELAAINSFCAEFPQARQRGCFFHFNQCVWRKIQSLCLARRYELDEEFALRARMIPSLAYVPPGNVIEAFEILTGGDHLPGELDPLVDYFEDTWIGRQRGRRNARRNPLFAVELWNCYESVRDGK